MENSRQKQLYDEVANHIQERSKEVNTILSNCSITSNFESQETQSKLEKVLSIDASSVVRKVSSENFYDSESLETIFKMLSTANSHPTKQPRLIRSLSQGSVASLPSSEHDNQENINEVKRQLEDVKSLLENLKDCPLNIPDMNDYTEKETEKRNKFIELVFKLQKLTKELNSIAATDKFKKVKEPNTAHPMTKYLLDDLNHLSQVRYSMFL